MLAVFSCIRVKNYEMFVYCGNNKNLFFGNKNFLTLLIFFFLQPGAKRASEFLNGIFCSEQG